MKKHIIKESVSLNDSYILEPKDEILVFSEKDYKDFIGKNKITEKVIKEDENDAAKDTSEKKPVEDKKDETAMPKIETKIKEADDDDADEDDDDDKTKNDNKKEESKQKIKEDEINVKQTTGEMLIDRFGLSELKNVYICKVTGSSVPIYHIVFDSYKENLALTKSSITAKHNISIFLGNNKKLIRSAFIHLRDYHGNTNGLFILNDLAGSYMGDIDF